MDSDDSDIGDMLDDLLANGDSNQPPESSTKKLQELTYNFLDSQPEKIIESPCEKTESLVHDNNADSSDEEDRKNFEDKKYSDYGRSLKNLLKNNEAPKSFEKPLKNRENTGFDFNGANKKSQDSVAPAVTKDVYSDPVFGLRMTKPLISSAELVERMRGRKAVTVSRVKNHIKSEDVHNDWVLAGVLISRSATKTSQKGTSFCVWKLSDLGEKMSAVSIFMFSGAYKLFWKTATGAVVGILNPNVMESKDDTDEATLSVDNAQRVMIMGNSRDMGKCKSTKKNGEPCSNIVNISKCEHCVYHVQQEYRKASTRSDIQSNGGPGKFSSSMTKKPKAPMSGIYSQNIVNQQNFTPVLAKRNVKLYEKDSARLALLRGASTMPELPVKTGNTERKKKSCMVELTSSQMKKDLEKLNKLRGGNSAKTNNINVLSETSKIDNVSRVDVLKNDNVLLSDKISKNDDTSKKIDNSSINTKKIENSPKIDGTKKIDSSLKLGRFKKIIDNLSKINGPKKNENSPKLDKSKKIDKAEKIIDDKKISDKSIPRVGSDIEGDRIDFSQPITKRHINNARENALRWIRENGDIKQSNPNKIRESHEKKLESSAKRRREIDDAQNEQTKKLKTSELKEEFKKMLEVKSAHVDLVEKSQDQDKEEYFKKLEIKERMEEKMLETYKVDCKAVKCLICKYTAFSGSELCKEQKHPLRVVNAVKSFFKCQDCGNRTVSLDRIPAHSCKKCSGSRWVRAAMMAEKKIEISSVPLSIRGGEEKFIGSVCQDANINLLVPDS